MKRDNRYRSTGILPVCSMAVSAMSPTGVSPVRGQQTTAGTAVRLTGEDARATHGRDAHATRQGTILIAVMVLTALSAMIAAGLLYHMQAEVTAGAAGAKGEQAYASAMSGLQRVLAVLRTPDQDWEDNPELLRNQLVCEDGVNQWYFTVYAPSGDGKTLRSGLEDEAGKINLNTCTEPMLRALLASRKLSDVDPDELADCLLDWRDRDSNARPRGAEQDYYNSLLNPYMVKNGPLGTMEELLLVKGFSARVVYGEDANLNGLLDPNEDDGDKAFPPDDSDGQIDRGLLGIATVCTHEPNVDGDGKERVFLNGTPADLQKLDSTGLKKEIVDFIRTCRTDGVMFKHPSELLGMTHSSTSGNSTGGAPAPRPRPPNGPRASGTITSPVTAEDLPLVLDRLTVIPGGVKGQAFGLVNVNTAPEEVLRLLPGMDESLAKSIVQAREGLEADKKATIAWLYGENLVPADKFKVMAPALTARSFQYHLRVVGFGVPCGRYRVIEAIIDTAGGSPRIAYLRDLTRLGPPAAMDVQQQEHRQ